MQFILLIILVQALYSAGDLVRKIIMQTKDFNLALFFSLPVLLTFFLSAVAFVIQMFVLKHYDLSRTITILASTGIVFSVVLGAIFFKEKLNLLNYVGVALAVLSVFLTHVGRD
jgi:multidrug transporter EmrE-like cation transporter